MKEKLITLMFLCFGYAVFSQNLDFEWAAQMGGLSEDISYSIAVDDSGNVYTTGKFYGTVDFDPGAGVSNLTPVGNFDVFIQKLDSNGGLIWAKSIGGRSDDEGRSIKIDKNGFLYLTGYFSQKADLDPGSGTIDSTAAGWQDVFVEKLDVNGDLIWVKTFGGISSVIAESVTIDDSGNVYTCGHFQGRADFHPGLGVFNLTSTNLNDVFIQKLDANGNFVWAKSLAGGNAFGNSISTDTSGNVYTTGFFRGTVDFNTGSGVSAKTAGGSNDIYVHKLDRNGVFQWAAVMGGSMIGNGRSIAVDQGGYVYSTGSFSGTVDFDPGTGTENLNSAGSSDIYIQKLNPNGNLVWAKKIGGSGGDAGHSISTDKNGNIYLSGFFTGSVDFDPNRGIHRLTANASADLFILKLDSSGNLNWALGFGGAGHDWGRSIVPDNLGNVYTTGEFLSTVDFDPDTGAVNLISNGNKDIYIQKLRECESYSSQIIVACDSFMWNADNKNYTSSGTYVATLKNSTNCDSVVTLHLTINKSTTDTTKISTCGSYTWPLNSRNYTTTGVYVDTLKNAMGCDSLKTLLLTINNNGSRLTTSSCNSYVWNANGKSYFTSGSYRDTLTNSNGCDSVVELNLTINQSSAAIDQKIACDSYQWIDGKVYRTSNSTATHTLVNSVGCDSIVTLNLTIKESSSAIDTQRACNSFTWLDGNTYTASNNTATYTITNRAGCDSIITLNLTINKVNAAIAKSENMLQVVEVGDGYQWLNCPEMSVINGEVGASFSVTENGGYAVIITKNGCVDTSDCIDITGIGILENDFGDGFLVFPNPTNGNFSIDLGAQFLNTSISISNLSGKQVYLFNYKQTQTVDIELNEPSGVYFISVESSNGYSGRMNKKAVIRLVKQ